MGAAFVRGAGMGDPVDRVAGTGAGVVRGAGGEGSALHQSADRAFSGILHLASRFMAAETRRAAGTLPVFLEYLASEQRFENAATRRWLEEAGIAAPGWESYIDAVLGAYLDAKTALKTASCYGAVSPGSKRSS